MTSQTVSNLNSKFARSNLQSECKPTSTHCGQVITFTYYFTVMLSPRGQAGLETKILSSASDSALKNCPQHWAFVLGMSSNFLLRPRENECNDGTINS